LSKYLKENDLIPSDKHTAYSLRHSFQNRLLAVNAPDRVQADLMGHKFNRPSYGDGSSLKQKLEWLNKIELKKEAKLG
jgi:integrase